MKKERLKAILAVYLVINKDNKTLLYLRQNTGYCDGMYSLIAGHVEKDESIFDAMIREAKEEAGIDIKKEDLRHLTTMHRLSDSERVDFFFELKDFDGKIINKEPSKCKELDFFDLDNLPKNTIDYVKKALFHGKNEITICDHGWE